MGVQELRLGSSDLVITGGTGSFGRQFIRTALAHYAPRRLIVFSRDEAKQHAMRVEYMNRASATDEVIYQNFREILESIRQSREMRVVLLDGAEGALLSTPFAGGALNQHRVGVGGVPRAWMHGDAAGHDRRHQLAAGAMAADVLDQALAEAATRRRCPATGTSVIDAWYAERRYLGELPILPEPFDLAVTRTVSGFSGELIHLARPRRFVGAPAGMAWRTAGVAAIVPVSPAPFTPSGLCVQGWLSSHSVTNTGRSSAIAPVGC